MSKHDKQKPEHQPQPQKQQLQTPTSEPKKTTVDVTANEK